MICFLLLSCMSYIQLYAIPPACQAVNAIIGDESIFAFWENVAPDELSEKVRIQTHLAYVEQQLRQKEDARLSTSQKLNRQKALNLLHHYWTTQSFPTNYDYPKERKPCFQDRDNNICAVGYLIQQTVGQSLVNRINADYQYAKIMDITLPDLHKWIEKYGLTAAECAMIQPNYVSAPKYPDGDIAGLEKFLKSKLSYPKNYGESKEVEFLLVIGDKGKVTHTETVSKKADTKLTVPIKKVLKNLTFEPAKAFDLCGDGPQTVVQYLKVVFNNKYVPLVIREDGKNYYVHEYCKDIDYEEVNAKEKEVSIFGWLKNRAVTTSIDYNLWEDVLVFVNTKKGKVFGKIDKKGRFTIRLKRTDLLNDDVYFNLHIRHYNEQVILRDIPFNHQKLELTLDEHHQQNMEIRGNCAVPKYLTPTIVIQEK